MTMPFSPCTNAAAGVTQCDDKSVQMLEHIFGNVINKLALDGDIESVTASSNILASMFSVFNSSVLVIGSIIITYIALIGVIHTANDGVALGRKWSSLWVPVRLVFSALMLLPTTSGYSMIQLFVFMIALWGAGAANSTYKAGMETGLFNPEALVQDIGNKKDSYNLMPVASAYVESRYCAKLVNAQYSGANVDIINLNTPDLVSQPNGSTNRKVNTYQFRDRNGTTNVSASTPMCGSVSIAEFVVPDDVAGLNANDLMMLTLDKEVTDAKNIVLRQTLFKDLDAWVASDEFPTSSTSEDWNKLNISKLFTIVNKAEGQISSQVQSKANEYLQVTQNADGTLSSNGKMKAALNSLITSLTKDGWAMAGGWFQRLGTVRTKLTNIFAATTGDAARPNLTGLLGSDKGKQVMRMQNAVSAKMETLKDRYLSSSSSSGPSMGPLENLVPSASSILEDPSFTGLFSKMQNVINKFANAFLKMLINTLVGSDSTYALGCGTANEIGGSLNRIKCVGDWMTGVDATLYGVETQIKVTNLSAKGLVALGAASPVSIVSDLGPIEKAVDFLLMGVIFPILEKIRQWVSILAFYFGVFLPALPYITFFTVVIGWVLSVIQTALVSPIWMLMHMQPEQSFVGSQRQGYLMLMSLFVRPMLALIGLFAAILVSDPVITYVTDAFFSMREALVTGGGTISTFSQVWQTFWWIGLYAAVLLPILYMIFGLAQSMPDEILRWVGGGIGSLGETNANSGIVGAMDSFGKSGGTAGAARDAAAKGMRAAKLQKERAAKAAEKGGQANGGSTRADSTLHPQQGVTPTGGGTGVVDVGQGAGKGFGGGRTGSRDGRFSGKQGAQQDVTDVEFREVEKKDKGNKI